MTALNKQALRVLALALDGDDWHAEGNSVYGGRYDVGDNVCYDHIASCESVNGESPHADFIAAANPATVLALLDELEKEKGYASAYEGEKWHYHQLAESEGERANRAEAKLEAAESKCMEIQRDKDSLEAVTIAMRDDMRDAREKLEAAERRIAELEAREVKLPPTFWYEHDDLPREIPVISRRLVINALREAGVKIAAGIGVKGE